jgi:proteasome accessory factor C
VSSRITSSARLRRILAIVPWIAERAGPTIDEVCDRFAIDRRDLLADLEIVFMVGLPPYTPDALIDVVTEDDRVWIRLGDYFRRPLRLTPAEGLSLLAAGEGVRAAPGADPGGPLARALTKLAGALGVRTGEDGELEVSLGAAEPAVLDLLRTAVDARRQVELDYYSYGRDRHAMRVVDPLRVYARDGAWYLLADCHLAGGQRIFRVDRIEAARSLDTTFAPPDQLPVAPGYVPGSDEVLVVLRLAPTARWVVEHHPVESVETEADGWLRVRMSVSALPWLARLLIRLGPEAEVVATEGSGAIDASTIRTVVADMAATMLARYRN